MQQLIKERTNILVLAILLIVLSFNCLAGAQFMVNALSYHNIIDSDILIFHNGKSRNDLIHDEYQDVKEFLDGAEEGAIVFSESSNYNSLFISSNIRTAFLQVFLGLPQRVVWNTKMLDNCETPSNVLITRLIPSNDVLGHPNVKCSISFGGIHDAHEVYLKGLPIILIPIFEEDTDIERQLEERGVAAYLNYDNLTEVTIYKTLRDVLKSQRYQKVINKKSNYDPEPPDPFLPWYYVLAIDLVGVVALAVVLVCKLIAKIIDIIRHLLIKHNHNYVYI